MYGCINDPGKIFNGVCKKTYKSILLLVCESFASLHNGFLDIFLLLFAFHSLFELCHGGQANFAFTFSETGFHSTKAQGQQHEKIDHPHFESGREIARACAVRGRKENSSCTAMDGVRAKTQATEEEAGKSLNKIVKEHCFMCSEGALCVTGAA